MPRVLIVDDSRMQSKIYETYLSKSFQCDVAPDGIDAVMMYRNSIFDSDHYLIVIMDISMPIMNGAEAINKIRKIESLNTQLPTSYIIISTSMTDHELKSEVNLDIDMADKILRKPVTKEQLLETIHEAIKSKAGKRS